jgi:hypothetical protein
MRKTFVETSEFTEWVKHYLSDEALADLQQDLQNGPDGGSVMPGCGGLQKYEWPTQGVARGSGVGSG